MAEEYVTALEDLYMPNSWVCAHRKGDENVPAEAVDRLGWADKVARPSTKAAQAARSDVVKEA